MFSPPGLPSESVVQILAFGLAPLAMVVALARTLYECAVDTPKRLRTENILIRLLSFAVIATSALAAYFWLLAPASLLQEWYAEVPNMAHPLTAPLLQMTDTVWRVDPSKTPITLSWVVSAATYQFVSELLRYLLSIPERHRAQVRFKAAEDAICQPPKNDESETSKSSILRRGY